MIAPEMRYAVYGATLALAWFAAINVGASLCIAWIARRLAAGVRSLSSGAWFAMRVLPAVISTLFVSVVFLPSYWLLEPRGGTDGDGFDLTMTVAAAVGLAACAAAVVRGIVAWARAARRTRAWMRTARPLALPGTSLTAFELDVETPLLALAGVLRPRLLITRGLIDALTADELAACVAHELAHFQSRDNVKRLAMRLSPDVLPLVGAAETIERQWASAAEHGADRRASHGDPQARCALASALLKVARLTPPLEAIAEPISTLVGGGDLASRVGRLLDERSSSTHWTRGRLWFGGVLTIATAAVLYTPLLYGVHGATEFLIRYLP